MSQKEKALISVIIPVYKVEEYLRRCVDSVIQQSYENMEIILVDDGSPDNCGKICDQYAKEYDNIKVIHQKNAGLSAARNTGIEIAQGEYLGFIDSDDFIEKDMYEVLYEAICSSGAQIAIGGIKDCYGGKVVQSDQFDGKMKVVDNKQAVKLLLTNKENVTAHVVTKLYSRKLFEDIRFPAGKLYEDVFTIIKFLLASDKIAVVNQGLYYYWHREESIVESPFNKRDMHLIEAWEENKKIILETMPELKEEMDYRYFWSCFYLLDKIGMRKDCEEEKELIYILRKSFWRIIQNKYFRNTRKLGAIVLKVNKSCYKILSKIQKSRIQQ